MKKIAVLGFGNFGTALAEQLAIGNDLVLVWSKESQVVAKVNSDHINPSYLSEIKLNKNIKATARLSDIKEFDLVLVALPAQALSPVFSEFIPSSDTLIISATKGIDHQTKLTPLQCALGFYKENCRYAVLSGPGFAKDIAQGRPAGLVAAAKNIQDAELIASLFKSSSLRVYASDDPIGVELGGIVKNVVAIAAGLSDGLNLGDSARAGIITRGFAEMVRLAVGLGAKTETLMGLSGMGDLVLTATCDSSRNRTIGLRLGRGEKLSDIITSLGSVAEGVMATGLVLNLARAKGIKMPVSEQVEQVLSGNITPKQMLENLMSRPLGREW